MQTAIKWIKIFILTMLVFNADVLPAAGTLDTSFGTGGTVVTISGSGGSDFLNSVAIQGNCNIITGGTAIQGGVQKFMLINYLPNGSLNTGFGGTGVVITTIAGSIQANIRSVAVNTAQKIVVGGFTSASGPLADFTVAQYNANGSLDSGFGTGGITKTTIGGFSRINGIALQADQKIVGAGSTNSANRFAIARYNTNGSIDTTFGGTGVVTTLLGTNDFFQSVAVQEDGKIVAVGQSMVGGVTRITLIRYNTNGSPDGTFGGGTGIVTTPIPGSTSSIANSVRIQCDDKIVIGGQAVIGSARFTVVRYNTDGSLDNTFGGGTGIVTTVIPGSSTSSITPIVLQTDGKIIAGGQATIGGLSEFAIARYTSAGVLDTTFGTGGVTTTPIGTADALNGLALQCENKVLAGGTTTSGGASHFTLAQYLNDLVSTTIDSFDASPNPVCLGSSTTLTATFTQGSAAGPFDAVWSDSFTQTNVTSPITRVVAPTTSTDYSFELIDTATECSVDSPVVTVTVNDLPTADSLSADPNPICAGSSSTLTGTFTPGSGTGPYEVEWSDTFVQTVTASPFTRIVTPTSTTNYSFTLTDSAGCSSATSPTVSLTVNVLPFVTITASATKIAPGGMVTLTATPSGNAPFTLVWSDGFVQTNVTGPVDRVVTIITTTTYNLTIIDVNGCEFDPPMGVTIFATNAISCIAQAILNKYCPV